MTVAMAIAPGVYARNRMFEFFNKAGVSRAKSRAATLRGIVRHLGRARAVTVAIDDAVAGTPAGAEFVLRYQIPAIRLARVVELSRLELATLRLLAARAGASCLPPDEADRALVDAALAQLLVSGEGDVARVTKELGEAPTRTRAPSIPPPGGE
ncbi:hypothetical protein AKJ09_07566 [Labilithrix luteola]|uniref:Uncharacterized protein n=1 Tax=Labilithrix luteola TaxID=1391654 RepID=A0A0K1Q593_9BACT|nr:hypothetical protein [Labilithrix luteola]AKV00903.1 hypothetical protein AKJ09_07566 [Labilithrix luteola]